MEEEGSFSSSSSSFSSNVWSVLSEQNALGDLTAPAMIRLAAQELRAFISADSTDGLTSHSFHIKKRENPEKKQKKNVTANQHACWCAVCDVCGDDREHTIDASTSSHHALYTFSKHHLKGKRHLDRGTQIIAANALVSSTAGLDDSAYAAAARSRQATERQSLPSTTNDTSARRDATPSSTAAMLTSNLEHLVEENDGGWMTSRGTIKGSSKQKNEGKCQSDSDFLSLCGSYTKKSAASRRFATPPPTSTPVHPLRGVEGP